MTMITAFLVTFLTANVPTLTGVSVSNFNQPILPLKHMSIRGAILVVLTLLITLISQVSLLQPVLPLLALVSVYSMKLIEHKLLHTKQAVDTIDVMVYGGVLTIFSTYSLPLSPVTPTFYAAILAVVVTYFVTITLIQLSQRRLRLAVVPSMFEHVPLLAMTLAILAMIFTGFTAIF